MKEKTVWVSRAMMDTTLVKGFTSDVTEVDRTAAIEAMKASGKGIPLPEKRFPKKMYGKYPDERKKRQPDFFMAGGFWAVSEEFADVLRRFDLGRTALYPVELFQQDRVTPVEGTYFCLAFGETKECFEPGASPNAQPPEYPSDQPVWMLPFVLKASNGTLSGAIGSDAKQFPVGFEWNLLTMQLALRGLGIVSAGVLREGSTYRFRIPLPMGSALASRINDKEVIFCTANKRSVRS